MIKYLGVGLFLFFVGMLGIFVTRKNIIIILMCVELMLLGINFSLLVFSSYLDDILGQVFSLFVLTVAAGESAIGLAILVVFYRLQGYIVTSKISGLKG